VLQRLDRLEDQYGVDSDQNTWLSWATVLY
jgi:hypothetical protein